MVIHN